MRVVLPQGSPVRRTLLLTGLDKLVPASDSVEAAVDEIRSAYAPPHTTA